MSLSKKEIRNGLLHYYENNVSKNIIKGRSDFYTKNPIYDYYFSYFINLANDQINNMINYVESKTDTKLEELSTQLKIYLYDCDDSVFKLGNSHLSISIENINNLYNVIFYFINDAYKRINLVIDEI